MVGINTCDIDSVTVMSNTINDEGADEVLD